MSTPSMSFSSEGVFGDTQTTCYIGSVECSHNVQNRPYCTDYEGDGEV